VKRWRIDATMASRSLDMHEWLDDVRCQIEHGQEFHSRTVPDVRPDVRSKVLHTRSQAVSIEPPGADITREPISRDSRRPLEQDAPVCGRKVEDAGRSRCGARQV
jgi:hypothetical protein